MSVPFRMHAPVPIGPWRPAPTGPSPAAPGLVGALRGYKPRPVNLANLVRTIGNPRNVRNFGIGGLVGTMIADELIKHANVRLALWLNGLVMQSVCDPQAGMSGWFASTSPHPGCLYGVGIGNDLRSLPAWVGALPPNPGDVLVRFIGIKTITWAGGVFGNEGRQYGVITIPAGQARPRPYFGPLNAVPAARPGSGNLPFPPGAQPWFSAPVNVLNGNPARPGVDRGNAPPISPPRSGAHPIPGYGGEWGGIDEPAVPPPWSWTPGRPAVPGAPALPGNPPIVRPGNPAVPIVRAPPKPWEREVKVGANTPAGSMFFALMRAKEAVSEGGDVIESLYKALPRHVQRRYPDNMGGHLLALYENIEALDFKLAFRNLLANQLEDELIGRSYFGLKGFARNAVFGNSMGALPGANLGLRDFAKAVSDAVAGVVDPWFGYEGTPEHRLDRSIRIDRERRHREIIDRLRRAGLLRSGANQPRPRAEANSGPSR